MIRLVLGLLLGCAAAPVREVRVPIPVLVEPSCEVPNMLERCRVECLEHHPPLQAQGALEIGTTHPCGCKPWDI